LALAAMVCGIHPDTVVVNWTQRNTYASEQPAIPLQQSSLQFFHNRNLKQVIALYYDDLPLTDEWLEDLATVANKIKARARARWPQ
jgi:hypothetical protein